jgi:nicotinamide-nucleotide adenylyltransferase
MSAKKRKEVIGVFWGRFNPPHHSHIDMTEAILKKVDRLIIAVGSSQLHDEKRNPFSGKERVRMMKAILKERGLPVRKIKVVAVETGDSYYSSVEKLVDACRPFDLLFTDKRVAIRMLERIYPSASQGNFRCRVRMHATQLRNAVAADRPWEHFTTKGVARIIRELDGVRRIKKAYGLRVK